MTTIISGILCLNSIDENHHRFERLSDHFAIEIINKNKTTLLTSVPLTIACRFFKICIYYKNHVEIIAFADGHPLWRDYFFNKIKIIKEAIISILNLFPIYGGENFGSYLR
jgi:hypothetical protein